MNIHQHGIEIERNFFSEHGINAIKQQVSSSSYHLQKHGIRNAENKFSTIKELVTSSMFFDKAQSILGSTTDIVRVIFFDKTADKNWLVTWHQDKTIAVSSKIEISGWGPWSIKDGIHHVQPRLEVLDKIVTLRLHLDDANEQNGCLKVIPYSHLQGLLSQQRINEIAQNKAAFLCEVQAGDLIIMKPHILHSSSKSLCPLHRRVVHIEYSNYKLPQGMNWA